MNGLGFYVVVMNLCMSFMVYALFNLGCSCVGGGGDVKMFKCSYLYVKLFYLYILFIIMVI